MSYNKAGISGDDRYDNIKFDVPLSSRRTAIPPSPQSDGTLAELTMGLTRREAEKIGLSHLYPKAKRKPSHTPGVPNLTERRFRDYLEVLRLAGEIRSYAFEPEVLPLGPEMTLTMDYGVEELDGSITLYDCKGRRYVWEDSTIKIKAAAVLYPQYRFAQAKWLGKGAGWKIRFFRSG
jgi:hypothetical protein